MAGGMLGEFEVLVLMAVLHGGDAAYPPAVRAEIESRSGRRAARGAVYVTLDRLETKRLLTSRLHDADGGGRPRRYYRVSARGLQALRRAVAGMQRMQHGLETLLPTESVSHMVPPAVVFVLRRIVPDRLAAAVIDDLEEDYRRVRARRRPWAARLWLGREVASIAGSFAAAALFPLARGGPGVLRDLRMAWRGIRQAPVAAFGAAATLAIGVLAVLLTTGLARAVLWRPISALHGEALRRVAVVEDGGRTGFRLSFLEVERIREHIDGRARHAAANLQPAVLRADGADLQTMIEVVDGGYFDLIGGTMVLGRALVSADDRAAAPPAVVISEGLWRRRFSADPAVLGRTVSFNRASFTIIGVTAASASASALGAGVDAWTPLAHADAVLSPGWRTDPEARWFALFALPSAAAGDLDAGLGLAARDLAARLPEVWHDRRLRSVPGAVLTGGQRSAVAGVVWILGGLAALILVVGAANVGGVLLAKAAATSRHTAIHLALGAGRVAIARRLLFEGAVLGGASGGLALAAYVWARQRIAEVALLPTLSLRLELPLDAVFAVTVLLVAAAGGLALGIGPAWWAMRVDTASGLGAGEQRIVGSTTVPRTRRLLVSAQAAVSLTLVVGAVLFSRSLAALAGEDLGFPRHGLVALDFDLAPDVSRDVSAVLARDALDRVAALPGVTGAAMSSRAPVDPSLPRVEVRPTASGEPVGETTMALATEDYFAVVGVPIVAGRGFSRAECARGDGVVIVNETLARRLWPDASAVGRALVVGADRQVVRVVGVAGDAKYRSISDAGASHVYRPAPAGFNLTLLVRTAGNPRLALMAVQGVLDGVGPGVVGFFPRTMDDHLAAELLPARVAAAAATGLGAVGLLLSGVCLYGLTSWLVERRRREIGVRMALGARPWTVVRLVVAQAAWAAAPGLAAGVVLAGILSVAVRARLFGVGPLDPSAFAIGAIAMIAVVVLAALAPSARASRIDPVVILRDS